MKISKLINEKWFSKKKQDHLYKIFTYNTGGYSGLWDHEVVSILKRLKIEHFKHPHGYTLVKNITPEQRKKFEKFMSRLKGSFDVKDKNEFESGAVFTTDQDLINI